MKHKKIIMVAMYDEKGGIGADNRIPWKIPADMQRFKQLTMGHTVIMGRKTHESMPGVLMGRHCIILTSRGNILGLRQSEEIASSIRHAMSIARKRKGTKNIFIIGGASVYSHFLQLEIYPER